ncbi:hypothetical protein NUW54_g12340 [Trametes sanguinea]|uniref:Uncharacterized protein n=1 Tax=Trametes sanguinea TaxID=158606 RepID=A0ACC1MYN7_9APHY|nr:hypothetical protein NUW54_g12340 [Trametes sanguinea]
MYTFPSIVTHTQAKFSLIGLTKTTDGRHERTFASAENKVLLDAAEAAPDHMLRLAVAHILAHDPPVAQVNQVDLLYGARGLA